MKVYENQIINELGLIKHNDIEINDQTLVIINHLVKKPKLIITKSSVKPLYTDDLFIETFKDYFNEGTISLIRKMHFTDRMTKFELVLSYKEKKQLFEFECFNIIYQQSEATLIFVDDITFKLNVKTIDQRVIQLSNSMLKINNGIDIRDQIGKTLDLVLIEALKVVVNGTFGSIFLVKDDYFQIFSFIGFSDEIENFKLPIADSFLYHATEGKMDQITIIDGIPQKYKVTQIKTSSGESAKLLSTVVAPIYYQSQLYGMMSIDSQYSNAFDENDLELIRIIRDNIQVIISNQLYFHERSQQALIDHMTGLYNRRYLSEQSLSIFERAKRYSEKFCIVVFDIDNLKRINDQYGHLAGDHVIKTFASNLLSISRRSDIIARFGGDEFVAIYLMSNEYEIKTKLDAMDKNTTYSIGTNRIELSYSFSYGIASFPQDGDSYVDLINIADGRMYIKK